MKKNKQKTKKALQKRIKVTKGGKLLRSHQLRSGHLRRAKTKRALRRHARLIPLTKSYSKIAKRMLGI